MKRKKKKKRKRRKRRVKNSVVLPVLTVYLVAIYLDYNFSSLQFLVMVRWRVYSCERFTLTADTSATDMRRAYIASNPGFVRSRIMQILVYSIPARLPEKRRKIWAAKIACSESQNDSKRDNPSLQKRSPQKVLMITVSHVEVRVRVRVRVRVWNRN